MPGAISHHCRAYWRGLAIFVNGAPSDLPSDAAAPTCIVARDVVQHARTIAEAAEIIRRHHVFVSAMFLVASRRDGRAVVIEKTPSQMAVREPSKDPWMVCANHYMTGALTNLAVNHKYLRSDTSASRYARMDELIALQSGSLDAPGAASILRDRLLPGDRAAGNGHRGSLNPLIATHSAVMDLTDGIFWAARSPHQLGGFVAIDAKLPERDMPESAIPPDAFLTNGGYDRFLAAQTNLDNGWLALKHSRPKQALEFALRAEINNPGFYRNSWLRAESLLALDRRPEALAACEMARAGAPALGGERAKLDKLRQRLIGVK